jgi:hypothetical protein
MNDILISPVIDNMILFKVDIGLLSTLNNLYSASDLNNPDHCRFNTFINYLETDNILPLDSDAIYRGELIEIKIAGHELPITINKDSFPLKLKKSEFNNIGYRIYSSPDHIFSLSKKFESSLENHSFTMFKLFQIV